MPCWRRPAPASPCLRQHPLCSHASAACLPACLLAGEVCLEAAPPSGQPAAPTSVQQLQLTLHDAPGPSMEAAAAENEEAAGRLTGRLTWEPPPSAAAIRCCHVWWSRGTAAADGTAEALQWQWLGAAFAGAFWLQHLDVLLHASPIVFAVQPEGSNGLVQDLAAAARCATAVPAGAGGAAAHPAAETSQPQRV